MTKKKDDLLKFSYIFVRYKIGKDHCVRVLIFCHIFMRKVNPTIGWRRGPTAATGVLVVSLYRVNRFRWREIRLMVFHPKTSRIPLLMKDLNDKASLHSISIVTGSQTTYPWWDFGATSELELCSRDFFYWFGFVSTQVRQLSQIILRQKACKPLRWCSARILQDFLLLCLVNQDVN